MKMESTRRPFDRSLSKEPGLKKPRLIEDPSAPDRISNGRSGFVQRPTVSNSGGGLRVQRDRDSESSDSARGPYPHHPGQQLHHELVSQYQTALAELTFNSKPIITNLTIIAGESLHAAKAIAATICANILEVPREQKLPSLYLLDSIVKNIGRDYIKYFASRLPEVFCKAYRQVDPSTHQGMRHLFGTWKGVFPPQTLQAIEKELGFTTTANGSPSKTSRPDSQSQRPAHSIHVNPKYLEARQQLQTTRARGPGSDTEDAVANSHEDEALERTASISSGRSWVDPYAKSIQHHPRDQVNLPSRDKSSSVAYSESEYGSNVSGRSGLGTGRVIEKLKEPGYNRYDSVSEVTGMSYHKSGLGLKHGVESYAAHGSANSDSGLQLKQHISGTNIDGMSGNWKNSEEEEYMWDEMSSRHTVRNAADASANDHWAHDNADKLDFDSHLRRPRSIHDIRSRDDDEASADSISMDLAQVASVTQVPSRSQNLLPRPEGRMLSGVGKGISGYPEGIPTGLKSSQSTVGRTPSQSQLGPAHIGVPSFKLSATVIPGPKVSMTQQRQTTGAPLPSARPPIHQRPPSPFSSHNPSQLLNNFSERNQTSIGPTDPRRPTGHRPVGYRDQVSEDSTPLPTPDVTQRLQPQISRSSPALTPTIQQKKHAPTAQQRNLEVSEFYSSGQGLNLLPSQISGSESRSTGNSSSDQSNPLTIDSPGKSITSSLFDSVLKSGKPSNSSLSGSLANSISRGPGSSLGVVKPPLSNVSPANLSSSPRFDGTILLPTVCKEKAEQPPLPTVPPSSSLAGIFSVQASNAVNSTSDPVSSLLSSLVAKGLISSSKPGPPLAASPTISDQHLDEVPLIASTSSTPAPSVPVTMSKPLLPVTDEPSSFEPAVETSDALPQSEATIKNLIGFEFMPNVVRKLHPDVISDLTSDLPHQCSICGLRLKLQERLDRHMEWHALRIPDHNNPSWNTSRRWYVDEVDWVAGLGDFQRECSPPDMSDETLETSEMVPADESQCACILCGELFEDFYSKERDDWMFKGAVYLTIPSSESHERIGTMSDSSVLSPIVHANCVSENSIHDLGLVGDVKTEKNA